MNFEQLKKNEPIMCCKDKPYVALRHCVGSPTLRPAVTLPAELRRKWASLFDLSCRIPSDATGQVALIEERSPH